MWKEMWSARHTGEMLKWGPIKWLKIGLVPHCRNDRLQFYYGCERFAKAIGMPMGHTRLLTD